ncbi:hypothetical protein NPIL_439431 [Nephila pilipes]|uniref:Uncharacterized protein n=1 Tax=Nephila pilipes TaxID=299642 RepID=A0A8X6U564_NEPPI|nr:hypothetical protein NPIL_439431 [Nephila pilipes]
MEKSEASAQRYNDYPDFGKDNRGASARSDMHCLKFFTVPSVHGTFLPSFSLVLLEGHVEEVDRDLQQLSGIPNIPFGLFPSLIEQH